LLEDPTAILAAPLLPSIFVTQTAFTVLLLPFQVSTPKSAKRKLGGELDSLGGAIKSKALVWTIYPILTQVLLQSLFLVLPFTLLYYTIIILFGAPLTTHVPQTLLLSLHIALLTIFPLFTSIIPTPETIRNLLTTDYRPQSDILRWTYSASLGTLLGAWLGPLDWDRAWQVPPTKAS
jgi:GPI ethanolamine phosphate transferase 2/3 subunit F